MRQIKTILLLISACSLSFYGCTSEGPAAKKSDGAATFEADFSKAYCGVFADCSIASQFSDEWPESANADWVAASNSCSESTGAAVRAALESDDCELDQEAADKCIETLDSIGSLGLEGDDVHYGAVCDDLKNKGVVRCQKALSCAGWSVSETEVSFAGASGTDSGDGADSADGSDSADSTDGGSTGSPVAPDNAGCQYDKEKKGKTLGKHVKNFVLSMDENKTPYQLHQNCGEKKAVYLVLATGW